MSAKELIDCRRLVVLVRRLMHSSGRGAVLRRDLSTYVDMPFIRCTKEKTYASLQALIVQNDSELNDAGQLLIAWSMVRARDLLSYHLFLTNVE